MNKIDILDSLNEVEKTTVIEILKEIETKGFSEKYNNLLYDDYEELPVDIDEFLDNPLYLGKGLINDEGTQTIFPYWRDTLKKIFPDPLQPAAYNTVALTGSIGIGKSFEAVLIGLYELYRMLCLKDPYVYYGMQPIDKITFAFMNITLDASKGVAWDKCQQLLQASPWFMSKGIVTGTVNQVWNPPKGIELIAGSLSRHIIGRAVFWAFFDEVSFQPNQDVSKQKEKAKALVNTASARMQSRFMKGEKNPTVLVLASSKRTEQSYMETFIEAKKKQESKNTLVVDEPQWVIRTDKDSPNKFKVAVGNKFLASEVLPLNYTEQDLKIARDRGYTIIDVPMGYYENFIDDIDIALTDIAGISTSSSNRYISGPRLAAIKNENLKNAFKRDVIEVGNAKEDTTQYWDFFDIESIPYDIRSKPLYIHLDMSVSGDKTGIAGVFQTGKKPPQEGQPVSKDMLYTLGFSVSIKAPKGYQISYEKNRNFIYWLKEQGFNIKGISTDTFQSVDTGQQLSARGFNYCVISVDRVDTDHICRPYQYLRSTIYEERISFYESDLLTEELLGLERDNNSGKIDHSPTGINCFTGDTMLSLPDGRDLSMLELLDEYNHGKLNYVYSINLKDKVIEPKPIKKVWCSGHNAKLVKITLDNGEVIRCTPEHRFMLRDGSYEQAQNLMPYDSLMPLYRKYPEKGLTNYRLIYNPFTDKWNYEHRIFASDVLDEKYLVHHKDCNPKNNRPDNLIYMSKKAHILEHAKLQTGAQSDAAKFKRSQSVKRSHIDAKNNEEGWLRYYSGTYEERVLAHNKVLERKEIDRQRIQAINNYFDIDFETLDKKTQKRYLGKWANICAGNNVSKNLPESSKKELELLNHELQENACKYFNKDISSLDRHEIHSTVMKYIFETKDGYKEHLAEQVSKNHKAGKYKKAHEAISNRIWYTNGIDSVYIKKEDTPPEGFYRGRTIPQKNHKVISIEFLDVVEDVYDIEVEDNHNFALSAGIFVHNSKDCADAVCGALWNASLNAEQYSFEYGEDLETSINVSMSTNMNSDLQQITVDFEDELKKAFSELHTPKNAKDMDFGFGTAKPVLSDTAAYISQGIMVW